MQEESKNIPGSKYSLHTFLIFFFEKIGHFSTPSVGELREEVQSLTGVKTGPGSLVFSKQKKNPEILFSLQTFHHDVIGDVLLEHCKPENHGAVFQVKIGFLFF